MAKLSADKRTKTGISLDADLKLVQARTHQLLSSISEAELKGLKPMEKVQAGRLLAITMDKLTRLNELLRGKPDSREEHLLPESVVKAIRDYLKGEGENGTA